MPGNIVRPFLPGRAGCVTLIWGSWRIPSQKGY
jgi:hypothetical protein